MNILPKEIFENIFSNIIDPDECWELRLVSKYFYQLSKKRYWEIIRKLFPPISNEDIEKLNMLGPHYHFKLGVNDEHILYIIDDNLHNNNEFYSKWYGKITNEKHILALIKKDMYEPIEYSGPALLLSDKKGPWFFWEKDIIYTVRTQVEQTIMLLKKFTPVKIFQQANSFAIDGYRCPENFTFAGFRGTYPILEVEIDNFST